MDESRIVKAIVDEYKDKPLGLDELKRIVRIALNATGVEWTQGAFYGIIDDVMYEFHGE